MPNDFSSTAKGAMFSLHTDEVFIILITITTGATPIRVCSNFKNVVSNGDTYIAYPFSLSFDRVDEKSPPRAKLVIDNVDQQITTAIRSVHNPLPVDISIILASDLDTIETNWDGFEITDVSYDAIEVEGTLSLENFLGQRYPYYTFSPANFPGIF